jgi:hypothetical protein
VAWRKGQNKDDVTPRSPKERTLGKIHILWRGVKKPDYMTFIATERPQ